MFVSFAKYCSSAIPILAILGMGVLPFSSLANINGSKHDLSVGMGGHDYSFAYSDSSFVCVYCHTPHDPNTNSSGKLSWNRSFSASPYSLYSMPGPDSGSVAAQSLASSSYSVICLSCHDGTIAVASRVKMATRADMDHSRVRGYIGHAGIPSALQAAFSEGGMSNDHPVGVIYSNFANTALNPENSITVAGLKLFEGKVECATCHDPHSVNNSAFTRIANTQSALCMTCHIK